MNNNFPQQDTYIFICGNLRESSKACGSASTDIFYEHFRNLIKKHKTNFNFKVKINKTGCLGRCVYGPNLVIFPENTWYTYANLDDIDEIFNEHILKGVEVTRLLNKKW